jgi:hypothetical protein
MQLCPGDTETRTRNPRNQQGHTLPPQKPPQGPRNVPARIDTPLRVCAPTGSAGRSGRALCTLKGARPHAVPGEGPDKPKGCAQAAQARGRAPGPLDSGASPRTPAGSTSGGSSARQQCQAANNSTLSGRWVSSSDQVKLRPRRAFATQILLPLHGSAIRQTALKTLHGSV